MDEIKVDIVLTFNINPCLYLHSAFLVHYQ